MRCELELDMLFDWAYEVIMELGMFLGWEYGVNFAACHILVCYSRIYAILG